jgi:hypothetical protein
MHIYIYIYIYIDTYIYIFMNIHVVASGRIGLAVLRRLHPFDVKLHYTDKYR